MCHDLLAAVRSTEEYRVTQQYYCGTVHARGCAAIGRSRVGDEACATNVYKWREPELPEARLYKMRSVGYDV